MFKKLLCISAAFILCLTSFVIPSFADDSAYFAVIPAGETVYDAVIAYFGNNPDYFSFKNNGVSDLYVCISTANGYTSPCVFSEDPLNFLFSRSSSQNYEPNLNGSQQMSSVTVGDMYYCRIGYGYPPSQYRSSNVSYFENPQLAYNALLNYSPEQPYPNEGFNGTLLIEAGYVAYIRVNGGTMKLTATMNELSGLSLGGSPWGNTSSIAYGVSDLPSSGTQFPLSSMSHIPWMKQAEGQNWLGQTRYAGYPKSDLNVSDNYIVIYNPAQPYLSSKGTEELSPTIKANFSKLIDYKKYPLTQKYDSVTGGTSSESISDFDDFYNGEADENGNFSETPSNNNMSPVATPGGTGDLATSGQLSVTEYIQQVNNTLTNFAKSVIDLLKAPISHVGELISAGSGFMSALRGLYAWLPVDIQGLLISALTVVIGIGVFKVFL